MKPRYRKVEYQVWVSDDNYQMFSNKADAVYRAVCIAISQNKEIFVRGIKFRNHKSGYGGDTTFGHFMIDVYPDGNIIQRGGDIGRTRASFTKYLRGYGKLYKGTLSHFKKWKGKK